jgi:hypothetical protein
MARVSNYRVTSNIATGKILTLDAEIQRLEVLLLVSSTELDSRGRVVHSQNTSDGLADNRAT